MTEVLLPTKPRRIIAKPLLVVKVLSKSTKDLDRS